MNRIDPAKVAEFFATHRDIEPIQARFVRFDAADEDYKNPVGCCGMTSLIIDDDERDFTLADIVGQSTASVAPLIAERLGVSVPYAIGFTYGWDTAGVRDTNCEEFDTGRDDGLEAYRLTMITVGKWES